MMLSRRRKYKNIARCNHRTYKKKKTVRHKRPCKECGRLFVKQHNRQEYCKGCQQEVRRKTHNKNQHDYHERWSSTINRRRLLKPGTNELPMKKGKTWEEEAQIITKEKNHTYNPYRKMYSRDILGF